MNDGDSKILTGEQSDYNPINIQPKLDFLENLEQNVIISAF